MRHSNRHSLFGLVLGAIFVPTASSWADTPAPELPTNQQLAAANATTWENLGAIDVRYDVYVTLHDRLPPGSPPKRDQTQSGARWIGYKNESRVFGASRTGTEDLYADGESFRKLSIPAGYLGQPLSISNSHGIRASRGPVSQAGNAHQNRVPPLLGFLPPGFPRIDIHQACTTWRSDPVQQHANSQGETVLAVRLYPPESLAEGLSPHIDLHFNSSKSHLVEKAAWQVSGRDVKTGEDLLVEVDLEVTKFGTNSKGQLYPAEIVFTNHGHPAAAKGPALTVEHIVREFHTELPVEECLGFRFPSGAIVAVMQGPQSEPTYELWEEGRAMHTFGSSLELTLAEICGVRVPASWNKWWTTMLPWVILPLAFVVAGVWLRRHRGSRAVQLRLR